MHILIVKIIIQKQLDDSLYFLPLQELLKKPILLNFGSHIFLSIRNYK